MKVLHVIPAIAPRYGGPSTAIWPMTAALARLGIEVDIATTDADGPDRRLTAAELPDGTMPVHLRAGVAALVRWLGDHVNRYDLVHTHSLWNRPVAAACAAARRAGIPYVIRPCGMLSPYSWRRRWWKKWPYWWAVERCNIRAAAALHVTSFGERQEALRCGVTGPVHDIPLGVDASAFETPRRSEWLRQRCGPAVGFRPIVLFLSRLHPKKGVTDLLLPAFASLKADAFLTIAGGVDHSAPGYETEIRDTISCLRLADRVGLIGPVPPADRWTAYDGADVFVLPSHAENFGIVVAEAMARGCPLVVTEAVQSCEHLTAAGAGRVVPVSVGPLAAALDGILLDQRARSVFGDAGRRYAAEHFTWDRIAQSMLRMYEQCLSPSCQLALEIPAP